MCPLWSCPSLCNTSPLWCQTHFNVKKHSWRDTSQETSSALRWCCTTTKSILYLTLLSFVRSIKSYLSKGSNIHIKESRCHPSDLFFITISPLDCFSFLVFFLKGILHLKSFNFFLFPLFLPSSFPSHRQNTIKRRERMKDVTKGRMIANKIEEARRG